MSNTIKLNRSDIVYDMRILSRSSIIDRRIYYNKFGQIEHAPWIGYKLLLMKKGDFYKKWLDHKLIAEDWEALESVINEDNPVVEIINDEETIA